MDQNKLCFYFLFNEVRGFFSSFNIKLFFFFLNDVPLEEKITSFMGTGRCEKLHSFQLWLASPTLKEGIWSNGHEAGTQPGSPNHHFPVWP